MVEEESGVEVHRTRRQFLSAAGTALIGVWSLPNLSAAIQNAVPPCRRPRLKITDVRTAQVMVHGHQVHVRVYTDQGIYGQGEATDAAVGAVPLIRAFKEFLLGQDPLNVDYLFEKLRTNGIFAGAQAGSALIRPFDLPAVEHVNAEGKAPVLVTCDHASRAVPRALQNLGLDDAALALHIGWDIGAAEVSRGLARTLDAPAILAGYSRLVIDCNRYLEYPT